MPTKLDSPDLRDLAFRSSHPHGADRSLWSADEPPVNDVIVDWRLDYENFSRYS